MVDTIADNASCDAYALIFTQAKMEINNINKDLITSQSNGVYTIDISGDWNNEDVIEVTITKDGSVFTPSSKEVSIYSDNNENNIEDKEVDFDKEDDEKR